jgi:hypothetical protein
MNAAPVEFERLDRLPICLSSVAAVVLERRTLETDMQRMPLVDPFVGLASSLSGNTSWSFLATVGEAFLEDAGETTDLAPEEIGSP